MRKDKLRKIGILFLIIIVTYIFATSGILYSLEQAVADRWYQKASASNPAIKIIAIDEKTLEAYGDMKTWNRGIYADLVDLLYEEGDFAPAVTVFDIMFIGEVEEESDLRFARSCREAGSIITAVNTVYETQIRREGEGIVADRSHIGMVEYPYKALKEASQYGYANTVQDIDGYIRHATTEVQYQGETIDSLAVKAYKLYYGSRGMEAVLPSVYDGNRFGFTYTGKSGAYEVLSMADVLEGKIPNQAFADSIVLVGAYAPGMQDAYNVAIQRGSQMYGVEIHANILEALLENKTNLPLSKALYGLTAALCAAFFAWICMKKRILLSLAALLLFIIANFAIGKALYSQGRVMSLIPLPLVILVIFLYSLISGYLSESRKKKKILNAFRKYVAPQVVDEIAKQGDFKLILGGESRQIAALFVDIRGFTPLSEQLAPEEVVEILNEYLHLTTEAIFKNGGTLDKFIGDAAMAVFNAPFDLEDYIYKAVCTARDIAAGSQKLEERLQSRFGKTVGFGIGVHCGPAVVGNIGCDFRMDYTAIGDTVNTAARLESNAGRGQILISESVYRAVKDRVEATEIGELSLKGKSKGVLVYQLDKVR